MFFSSQGPIRLRRRPGPASRVGTPASHRYVPYVPPPRPVAEHPAPEEVIRELVEKTITQQHIGI